MCFCLMNSEIFKTIGKSVSRKGAVERLTGQITFAADLRMEGTVTLMALRSDRHHALIVDVDTAPALKIPGCIGVFTSKDIPGRNRLGIINKDQRLLAATVFLRQFPVGCSIQAVKHR